jgi:WD40 repeat protein
MRQMPDRFRTAITVALSSDGRLVAGSNEEEEKGNIRVWDLETDTVRTLERARGSTGWSLVFGAEGSLFSGDREGKVMRWNIHNGSSSVVGTSKLPVVYNLVSMPNAGCLLANFHQTSVSGQNTLTELTLYDLKTGSSRAIRSQGSKVTAVAVDSSETILATGDAEGIVRVGSFHDENPHILLGGMGSNSHPVATVTISPDGRWVAAAMGAGASFETPLRVWRMPQGRPLQTLSRKELLGRLKEMTNLRVVIDKSSNTGYRIEVAPFPGWEKVPAQSAGESQ